LKTSRVILALNSGSSSRKIALYRLDGPREELIAQGAAEGIGLERSRLWVRDGKGKALSESDRLFREHADALEALFVELKRVQLPNPDAVGHRLVHGGPDHSAPEVVTAKLLEDLQCLAGFAPLHLPDEIDGIRAAASHFPQAPQVACFDTAFHQRMPAVAKRLALPRSFWDDGIRRYGFHGISYEYIMECLGHAAPSKIILAHLGNGASLAAVRGRSPIDTTMGFTPAGGLMMGTRSGDLDPGVILYLLNDKRLETRQVAEIVNSQSGLLGVSGISPDMRALLRARESDAAASEAVAMFCYQLRKYIGAFAAALGGLDLLVFTGGIGEHADAVRWEACEELSHLGIKIDKKRNRSNADTISASDSRCTVRVIPTNEDLMIARHTARAAFSAD
jgi:acetate kinase